MAETVLFAEQTVTGFAYSNAFACFANGVNPAPFVPVQGRSYIVNWDGEQFTRTAFSFVAADGASCIGIGNTIMTGTDSGEPFLIAYDATNGYFYFFSTETDSSHTISVLLQEKSEAVLLEKRTIDNFVYVADTGIYRPNPTYIEIETDTLFVDGERYKITWDDVVYYCTSEDGKVGNQHLSYGKIGPGEPFTMLSFDGCVFFYTTLPGTSHTVEISQVEQPIVLKDRNNNDVPYDGAFVLKIPTADGGTRMFIEGEVEATTISLDFSQGDMEVVPDAKKLFNKVSIPTPANLIPDNIAKGVNVAGIIGSLSVGSENILAKIIDANASNNSATCILFTMEELAKIGFSSASKRGAMVIALDAIPSGITRAVRIAYSANYPVEQSGSSYYYARTFYASRTTASGSLSTYNNYLTSSIMQGSGYSDGYIAYTVPVIFKHAGTSNTQIHLVGRYLAVAFCE